jgi:hypothetical protein
MDSQQPKGLHHHTPPLGVHYSINFIQSVAMLVKDLPGHGKKNVKTNKQKN